MNDENSITLKHLLWNDKIFQDDILLAESDTEVVSDGICAVEGIVMPTTQTHGSSH